MRKHFFLFVLFGLLQLCSQNVYADNFGLTTSNNLSFNFSSNKTTISFCSTTIKLSDYTDVVLEEDCISDESHDLGTNKVSCNRLFIHKNWNINFIPTIIPNFSENKEYNVPILFGMSQPIYLVIRVLRI